MQAQKLLIALVMGASLIPATTLAGTESGFYLGAGVGQGSVGDIDLDDSSIGDIDFDGDDTGFKIFGGYNFGWIPFLDLAIEGGYVDLGKSDDDIGGGKIEVDPSGFDVFGLVGVTLGPIGLFGKAGMVSWDVDVDTPVGSFSDDGTDPAYGIGARLKFGSLEARAEYEYFDVDSIDSVDFISVSGVWTF